MPTFRNILEDLKPVDMIGPDDQAAATYTGSIIDRKGYDQLVVLAHIGTGVATKVLDLTLYDDIAVGMGTEALFATIGTITSQGDDDTLQHAVINLKGANRYVRIKGINNDLLMFAVTALLGRTNALALPPTQEQTALAVTYA